MRPAKSVLLVGSDEDGIGILKYVIANNRPKNTFVSYSVTTALSVQKALSILAEREFEILLCQWPLDHMETFLQRCAVINPRMPRVVLTHNKEILAELYVWDVVLYNISTFDLLGKIKVLSERKRGRRKQIQPVASECFTLVEGTA